MNARISVRRGRFSGSWWVYGDDKSFGVPFPTWHQAMAHAHRLAERRFDDQLLAVWAES